MELLIIIVIALFFLLPVFSIVISIRSRSQNKESISEINNLKYTVDAMKKRIALLESIVSGYDQKTQEIEEAEGVPLEEVKLTVEKEELPQEQESVYAFENVKTDADDDAEKIVEPLQDKEKKTDVIRDDDSDNYVRILFSKLGVGKLFESKEVKDGHNRTSIFAAIAKRINFEDFLGTNLLIWIGSIAIIFAGFFLVKYSIEKNLINPQIRVAFGFVLSIILLYSSLIIFKRPKMTNGLRIAQALSGAGFGVMYFSVYAASAMYGMIHPFIGFALIGAVTLGMVFLSLYFGIPILILSMVSGYLTPALLSNYSFHFSYTLGFIFVFFCAFLFIASKKGWWKISVLAVIVTFAWGIYYIINVSSDETFIIGLFVLGISGAIVGITNSKLKKDKSEQSVEFDYKKLSELTPLKIMHLIGLGSAGIVLALLLFKSDFSLFDWGMYAFFSAAGLMLTFYQSIFYRYLPVITAGINLILFLLWEYPSNGVFLGVIAGFSYMYGLVSFYFMWRHGLSRYWGYLGAFTVSAYSLIFSFRFIYEPMVMPAVLLLTGLLAVIVLMGTEGAGKIQHETDRVRKISVNAALLSLIFSISFLTGKFEPGLLLLIILWLILLFTVYLSFKNKTLYGYLPIVSSIMGFVVLFLWYKPDFETFIFTSFFYFILFYVTGLIKIRIGEYPLLWGISAVSVNIIHFFIPFLKLSKQADYPVWGAAALIFAALNYYSAFYIHKNRYDNNTHNYLILLYFGASVAFLTSGCMLILDSRLYPAVFAAELLFAAWALERFPVKRLVAVCWVLFGLTVLALLNELGYMNSFVNNYHFKYNLFEKLFNLAVPTLLSGSASYFLGRNRENNLAQAVRALTSLLVVIMVFLTAKYFIYQINPAPNNSGMWLIKDVFTNMFFIISALFLRYWKMSKNRLYNYLALLFLVSGAVRFVQLYFISGGIANIVGNAQGVVVINSLLFTLGLPAYVIHIFIRESDIFDRLPNINNFYKYFALILSFIVINMNVRFFFFHHMGEKGFTNPEIYSYSAVWLLSGILFMVYAVIAEIKSYRIAALVILTITVFKVFIYDASALTGLLRVFSFLGLGLSLIGIGYFYSRFVVKLPEPGKTE